MECQSCGCSGVDSARQQPGGTDGDVYAGARETLKRYERGCCHQRAQNVFADATGRLPGE
jgi:hypothetical protein